MSETLLWVSFFLSIGFFRFHMILLYNRKGYGTLQIFKKMNVEYDITVLEIRILMRISLLSW